MSTAKQKLFTADDLLSLDAKGIRGELVRGVLVETMSTGREHGQIVMNTAMLLGNFIKPNKLGVLVGSDSGVWLERDPDTVREPDIAFTSVRKAPPGQRVTGYSQAIPDLVVEVASPSDTRSYMVSRADMWRHYGVTLIWIVHPDTRTVDVYHHDHPAVTFTVQDTLEGLDVLPGFTASVADIFDI